MLILLWVMGVGFENTCTVSRKCNVCSVAFQELDERYIMFYDTYVEPLTLV